MTFYQSLERLGVISIARVVVPGPARRRLRALQKRVRRLAVPLSITPPAKVWGTKGFQFWTFLSLLLMHSNCSRLLELGSGRSTITLAEYARFRKARFISLETSLQWFNKARLELRCLGLPDNPVRLLDWEPGGTWYDVAQFRAAVCTEGGFDFVFIDGPNHWEGNSRGIRDSDLGMREIRSCAQNADIVVVDDVHRRHIFDTVDRILTEPDQYDKWVYDYGLS